MTLKEDIARKANVLLVITLVIFGLIGLRVAQLTLVQHRHYNELSKRPQHKTVIEEANRGTIRDRWDKPLAINQLQYNAAVIFDDIRTIPKVKKKVQVRRRYIEQLAQMLGSSLGIDPLEVEDTIYSHASIFPNTPFILKQGISERKYHELKMLERKWPGLKAQISSKRAYPNGKLGCNLLGYMGAINHSEHVKLSQQMRELRDFILKREAGMAEALPNGYDSVDEVIKTYADLKNKSYSINSYVGKSGIEKQFNNELRGFFGKRRYEVSTNGHRVRELPDSYRSDPGERIFLNIDSQMQAYAEELLTQNEEMRDRGFRVAGKHHNLVHPPWIKGGAIVVMNPKSGEVLTMASYPRFDPNDFVYQGSDQEKKQKQKAINKWLESPRYISAIWDGAEPLEREYFSQKKGYYDQKAPLTWNHFLEMILSKESIVKEKLHALSSMNEALQLLKKCHQLILLADGAEMWTIFNIIYEEKDRLTDPITLEYTQDLINQKMDQVQKIKSALDPYLLSIETNADRLLFLDLIRLCVPYENFSPTLMEKMERFTLDEYRSLNQAFCAIEAIVKPEMKELFHAHDFLNWRTTHFKSYLKQKRKEEKEQKRYQKPYLEYLHAKEKELFDHFYQENRWKFYAAFLSISEPNTPYTKRCKELFSSQFHRLQKGIATLPKRLRHELIQTFMAYDELDQPVWGRYHLKRTLKDLARHFYPASGFGYSRSYAFQEAAPQGSIFKIVTAFEALNQNYKKSGKVVNPLTIIDSSDPKSKERRTQVLGYHLDGRKITRNYRGGRLPASYKKTGKVDLPKAFELSSNIYFSLLASDVLKQPIDLTKCSRRLNLGRKTGIDLPGEIRGILPTDIVDNRTGLYSLAIGQHTLIVSPLQTATMLSAIANGGAVLKPQVVHHTLNRQKSKRNLYKKEYPFKNYLNLVGLDFPFFSEALEKEKKVHIAKREPLVTDQLDYPKEVKHYLLNGLHKVVNGERGSARINALHSLIGSTEEKRAYSKIGPSMVGKTASAEILYRPCLDRSFKPIICKHIWFSAASFHTKKGTKTPNFDDPELVVIVYLRYGDFGKEAAPIASKMIQKYRQIKDSGLNF